MIAASPVGSESMVVLLEVVRTSDDRRSDVLQTEAAVLVWSSPKKKGLTAALTRGKGKQNPSLMGGKAC